jgi:elongation factor P--(R)-beta-lysine ligase
MKRLLAAGSGSIYQICKAYRNGEYGRTHNPEFTILEWYRVGADLELLIIDIENLLNQVLGLSGAGQESERISYQQAFLRHCGVDPLTADIADFNHFCEEIGDPGAAAVCGDDRRLWQEYLFGLRVQPQLGDAGLCFVTHYPANQCALARIRADDPRLVDRVEVFYQGVELANGFGELNCAQEQRERFSRDLENRARTGKELPPVDERFLGSLAAGLPDCSGVAVGLDRLLMLLMKLSSLDEVLTFSLPRA